MSGPYNAITPIILASLIFQLGNGLLTTLLSLRLDVGGFSTQVAGLVSASYYAGLLLGTIFSQDLIFRIGHIRAFATFAAVAAATMLLHAMFVDPLAWCAFRVVGGFAVAALFLIMESWLNMSAGNEQRGRVFSIYMTVNYAAVGAGQLLLNLYGARGFEAFSLSAILVTLALVPICVTRQTAPTQQNRSVLTFRDLYRISPVGIVGSLVSGAVTGPLYGLLPIFARQSGLTIPEVSLLMTAAIFGGFILAWPVGRLSDRIERRTVLVGICALLAAVSLLLTFVGVDSLGLLLGIGALFGGIAFALYPICVAHTNDYLGVDDAVAASGGLLMAFGVGAMVGPVVAATAMDAVGPSSLFLYMAICAVALGIFTVYRRGQRLSVSSEDKTVFVPLANTTPAAYELDPWSSAADAAIPDEEAVEPLATPR